MITILAGSPEQDAASWAEEYGVTHPVIADPDNDVYWAYVTNSGYPDLTLFSRGLVIAQDGVPSIDTEAVEDLL